MDDRSLRLLEFHAIRDQLVGHTVTAPGRELAAALVPATDPDVVARRLEETEEADRLTADGELPLRGAADVRAALQRAARGGTLEAAELLAVRDALRTMRRCKGYVLARAAAAPRLAALSGTMPTFDALEEAIGATVADDGAIPDGASADLARLRREQRAAQARLRETLEHVLRGPYARMLQDPIVTVRGDRAVVPVRQEFKGVFPGVLHDQSSSGATAFMEPLAAVPLGNRLRELASAEAEEVRRLLYALSMRVGQHAAEIGRGLAILGQLDVAAAKAHLARAMRATRPVLRQDGALRFVQARHPLLGESAVPIDVWLGTEFTTLVITGPNTGGKTVTLKTVGLLTLMAQAGLFVPAAEGSEAAVFPQVFADIGDEQSIAQSLSTFSSHVGAIAAILRQLRGPALVLLDEIGAGTDPTEGTALARAILEHLHARGARTVVTTHYSALKALAYSTPGIQNASVEFDAETLRPTYRLLIGLPGRSNALTIAARLGLDPQIVAQARRLIGSQAVEIDRIIGGIEADRRAIEEALAQAARARRDAELLRQRAAAELERLRVERRRILAQAREEMEALLGRAREEVEALLARLKAAGGPQPAREARAELRRLADALLPPPEEVEAAGEPVREAHPGQRVFIVPLRQTGTVLTGPDHRGEVEVDAGGLRVRVGLAALRAAGPAEVAAGEAAPVVETAADAVPLALSLRGQRVDEAIPALDKYLDAAFLAGYPRVTIIHGKGTGALRRAVHDHLAHHPHVKAFRLGARGEGESGATIVELNVR
ncbi:MAG TPA: endonuclease MutS2 [bacterium]|nr:endonuclease MutS2 [bacterium]